MRVAMYLRLSSEDDDLKDTGKAESESISNQRGLLQNFISSRSEFSGWEISEFCDDGWSGKNFERPDFLRMMEQVKQGQIHCIVVKDLSRFGRDYLVVGNYISRVFPVLGVRFIAVNDGFDSSRPQDIDSLDTAFKTLIYDLYSRELSGKVKNAKRMRAEKGLFLRPFAPYGYVKDPEDKNRLLIDKEATDIVRKIFALTIDGVRPTEIAAMDSESGYIIIDARTQEEYNQGHIPGAIMIPEYEIAVRAEKELPYKNQLILVYCRSGRRSKIAAEELVKLGYTNVKEFGGIIDWEYETVK